MPKVSTFEYQVAEAKNNVLQNPAYLFLIDLCVSEKELASIQEEMGNTISLLPDNTRVGIVTFNKFVHVYELASKINVVYCVNGSKEYSTKQLMEIMGITIGSDPRMQTEEVLKRFVVDLHHHRERILRRLRDIKPDPFIYVGERPLRVTGQALNVATFLAEVSHAPPKIVLLVGGPCTGGPGQVIAQNYKLQMRSAEELGKGDNIPFFEKARKFYE